jgi:hypothetical protein
MKMMFQIKGQPPLLDVTFGQIVEKTYLAPSHIQRWDNDLSNTHKE